MQNLKVKLDSKTGKLSSMIVNGVEVNVDQSFLYYESAEGDNEEPKNRSSGAYIFRPRSSDAKSLGSAKTKTYKGKTKKIFINIFCN